MTPAQRKYDTDLAAAMRDMAVRVASRSRKISDTLKVAADRLDALSSGVPVDPVPELDHHGNIKQPASTLGRASNA